MKFIVFSTDLPPISGHPTSGTALRTWNLAEGLKELGHEIILSPPKSAVDKFITLNKSSTKLELIQTFIENAFDSSSQLSLIAKHKPDAILCGHWPAWTVGRKPAQPLIIDLAGPHLLERHYQGDNDLAGGVLGKLSALSAADYFIISGQKQRLYFLSFLLRAKLSHPEERFCNIPMPLPLIQKNEIQNNSLKTEPSFIFGGVFLPWQDPTWGLNSLCSELTKRGRGHLTLVGGPHPHYPIDSAIYQKLFDELEYNPSITRKPLLPYDDFQTEMKKSSVALDLMAWNLERELAMTIRSCTYLWSGVPIIYNDFADLSKLIKKYDAGWCIKPGDTKEFNKTIEEIYSNPDILETKRLGAYNLAKDNFDRRIHAQSILSLLSKNFSEKKSELDITIESGDNCHLYLDLNTTISQNFVSRIDGLKEIKILIGTHGKKISEKIIISLHECSCDRLIAERIFSCSEISDNQWLTLDFQEQTNSAGKNYVLSLKTLSGAAEANFSPWTISYSPYPLTGLYINSKKHGNYSMCVKTFSSQP